ncbi:MAG: hypothetical protein EMLJLAPB_01178 [Candidatus Argoarchaeum ethanivorans]|uniref:Macroglobulin domain-containing protein n=1 Tax=Candidatus Argoarchaeum ethanivorans TaxID=2608793 RepID=A0A811TKW0_9EURY|nr:MAG: hypothetical protein EMLJLAPB_01178 [Candidatus Argoarchaeum ethanivorans]
MRIYVKVFFIAVLLTVFVAPSQSSPDSSYEYKIDLSGVEFWLRFDLTDAQIAPRPDHGDMLEIPVEIEIIDMGGKTSICFDKITFSGEHAGFDSEYQLHSEELTHAGETFNNLSALRYDPGKLSWIKPGSTGNENITFKIFGRVNGLAMPAFSGIFEVPITTPSSSLTWEYAIKPDELGGMLYEYEPFAIEFTLKNTGKYPVYIRELDNELYTMEPGETYSKVDNFSRGLEAGNYTARWRHKDYCGTGGDGHVYYITYTGYQGEMEVSYTSTVLKRNISWSVPEQISLPKLNRPINISGTITRLMENETVNLTIIDPDRNTFSVRDVTAHNNTFSDVFTPNSTGKWKIVAKHKLKQSSYGEKWIYESSTTYIDIALEGRKLSIRANPVEFGRDYQVNISGTISPYSDIVGDIIAISYSYRTSNQEGEWLNEVHNVSIQEDGTFFDTQLIPQSSDYCTITAGYGFCTYRHNRASCAMYSPCIAIRRSCYGGVGVDGSDFDLDEPVRISIRTEFNHYFLCHNQNASDTLTLTIIKPDGAAKTEIIPAEDDTTYYSFIPDRQVGKWEVKADWSGISRNCTFIVENETCDGHEDDENDEDNSIPGFEGVLMIGVFTVTFCLNKKYWRK